MCVCVCACVAPPVRGHAIVLNKQGIVRFWWNFQEWLWGTLGPLAREVFFCTMHSSEKKCLWPIRFSYLKMKSAVATSIHSKRNCDSRVCASYDPNSAPDFLRCLKLWLSRMTDARNFLRGPTCDAQQESTKKNPLVRLCVQPRQSFGNEMLKILIRSDGWVNKIRFCALTLHCQAWQKFYLDTQVLI